MCVHIHNDGNIGVVQKRQKGCGISDVAIEMKCRKRIGLDVRIPHFFITSHQDFLTLPELV